MKARFTLLCFILSFFAHYARAQSPLEFVENKGQWGKWFMYKTAAKGGDVCLEKDGLRFILADRANNSRLDSFHHGIKKDLPVLKFHCYKITFEGASIKEVQGENQFKVYYNYFLGNDSSRWKSGIHPYRSLNATEIYNGIDMHLTSEKGNVIYDFIVQPQADASQIKLNFHGQDNIRIKNNTLAISTTVGDVTETEPIAYQYNSNYDRVNVACKYRLRGNVLSFDFPDDYDHSQRLFIDPTVVFCTLTGSTADNWGFTATYDAAGNFYNGGIVNTLEYGGTFPFSPGAFQTTFGGGETLSSSSDPDSSYASDISIIKYNPTGVDRIYATYLGGNENDRPHSMIVDASNELVVAGRSLSSNFPVTPGAYKTTNSGGWDIILTKFNAAGTALIGSTYIGGSSNDGVNFDSTEWGYGQTKFNYGDDARSEVQLDNAGNIYLAGCTTSTDFPVTATAISSTLSGNQDGVVVKLNPTLTTLIWSTYLGGNGADAAYVLAFDSTQASLYVAGGTSSTDFPATAGTLHTTYQGGRTDGFIAKFQNSAPYNLQAATYVGTSNYDQVYGIQVSDDGYVYVMGQSLGGTFPVTAGVYSNPNSCQFIMKTDQNLVADLVSTVFGNGNPDSTNISPVAFLVDTCQNVYISGWGGDLSISSAFEATGTDRGMPVTSDAVMPTTGWGRDFYFIVLGSGLSTLRYATYYGRTCAQEWEGGHVDGGTSRFDKHGIIYQAMCANCGGVYNASTNPGGCMNPYPTTTGVWSMMDSSANCNEAALKIAFNIGPVQAIITAGPSTSGCAPLTVDFTNSSNNGLSYVWNFGDGSAVDTSFAPTHTFTAGGTYTVTLSAANSNACFVTNDTAHLIIVVDTNKITPGLTFAITDSCGPYTATFANTSTYNTTTVPTYQWWFGNGSVFTGVNPPPQSYPDTGTFTVTFVMTDTAACNSPDTIIQQIHIYSAKVSAHFIIPDSVCAGTSFTPTGGATNATTTTWIFGGQASTAPLPTFTFDSVGVDTITLIAQNPGACNGADTFTQIVSVLPVPVANFSFVPLTPVANIPTTFTNLSTNATRYSWDFGDNTSSTEINPIHQYSLTGTYKVCLTAYNNSNCPAIACRTVPADVEPELGLPTAFTPNGDGDNDILYVRGAAIVTMDLKIFNRWGQLVFETTNQSIGWDGKFNGQPQPIEAYAYVLHATFIDGSSRLLKGNVTLLR